MSRRVRKSIPSSSCRLNGYWPYFFFHTLNNFSVDGRIGEGKEDATHLITLCTRAAAGKRPYLRVFGTDYPTPDGTCIRDYIHVEDLAEAHVLGLEHLLAGGESEIFNCGYGKGYSVLEVIEAAKKVTGADFPVKYEGRRPGDPPVLVADPQKIRARLGWVPSSEDLERIVYSAWRWEQKRKVDVKC